MIDAGFAEGQVRLLLEFQWRGFSGDVRLATVSPKTHLERDHKGREAGARQNKGHGLTEVHWRRLPRYGAGFVPSSHGGLGHAMTNCTTRQIVTPTLGQAVT